MIRPHCNTCRCTTLPVTHAPTAGAVPPFSFVSIDYSRFTGAAAMPTNVTYRFDTVGAALPAPRENR